VTSLGHMDALFALSTTLHHYLSRKSQQSLALLAYRALSCVFMTYY
jgi:hypothetical protein